MLRSDFIEGTMVVFANGIKLRAEILAPVDEKGPHPGRYKAGFKIRHHSHGGATKDRAEAFVYNDTPEAVFVEFARWGDEPYHTLANAAFQRFS